MNYIDPQTWNVEYNADELARQENEGVPKAIPLAPEEEKSINQREQKIEWERRAALNLEKGKESAWTHTKLEKLAFDWIHKRKSVNKNPKEHDLPVGGITENLERVDPIILERLGEPLEFEEDLNLIRTGFDNEKLIVDGNEMQEINPSGETYLYWLLIKRHIFERWFSIRIDANDQPIIHDESGDSSQARQEQTKGLQKALSNYELQEHHGHVLKNNDNSSLTAEYMAAEAAQSHPNLIDYRNSLFRKVGITSTDISLQESQKRIETSNLSPAEKSFLLAWRDTRKDKTLHEIERKQDKFVKNARENFNQKSPETHLKELADKPFTKSAQLLAVGAIGTALLVFAYKQMKKGGVWWTISWLIAGLIGWSIMLPLGDKAWSALGWSDYFKKITTWAPMKTSEGFDNPFENMSIIAPVKAKWERFQARLSGSTEGLEILMNEKVGPDIGTKYPVYSMLNSLNPDEKNIWGNYEAPDEKNDTTIATISAGLDKLKKDPNQKAQLNVLLTNTWERYQKTNKFSQQNEKERKTTNLSDMLANIEAEDGWFNTVVDFVSDEPEKVEAMKVIGQNPKAWGNLTLKELNNHFGATPSQPNSVISANIAEYKAHHGGNPDEIMQKYITAIKPPVSDMTLRQYLEGK